MALFVGRLPPEIKVTDLEEIFKKFGPVSRLDVKRGTSFNFAFVEFEDKRDAEDAVKECDGKELPEFNTRLVVEWSKGGSRKSDSNECFKCGQSGHWARDCPSGGGGRGGDRYSGDRYGGDRDRDRYDDRRRDSRSPPRRR